MKHLLFLLVFLSTLFSNELTLEEESAFRLNPFEKIDKNSTETLENNTTFEEVNFFKSIKEENNFNFEDKKVYLSYTYYPKKLYKNQRFTIDLKSIITTKDFTKIETRFLNLKNIDILNPTSTWQKNKDTYLNSFEFKIYSKRFTLPTFQVVLYNEEEVVYVIEIKPKKVVFINIPDTNQKFTNVYAKDLKVLSFKSKQYSNDKVLSIVEFRGEESNLEDFFLKNTEEQKLSALEDKNTTQFMEYFIITPIYEKAIEFSYYNTIKKDFVKFHFDIELDESFVSTQTDLNPNNSNVLFYKKVAFSSMAALFLLIFLWKRNYTYLIICLVFLIITILYFMPNEKIVLKKSTNIYILPTKNSTVFHITDKKIIAERLMKKDGFIKIMFKNRRNITIGWVKENDFIKN